MSRLEHFLGVTIFERQTRGVVPTEIGRRLIEQARLAVAHADALVAEARDARDPFDGPLALGVIPTLGPYLMPLVFGPLDARHPSLKVQLWEDVTPELVTRLRDGRLDAILVASETEGADLAATTLFEEPFLALLPTGHRLSHAGAVDQHELASDILVLPDPHCLREQALAACGGTHPEGGIQSWSLETLVNMVAAGFGTTLMPLLAARQMGERDIAVKPLRDGTSRTVRLVSRATSSRGAVVDALAGLVQDVALTAIEADTA